MKWIVLLLLLMPLAVAHDGEYETNYNSISPFTYFSQGEIGLGIVILGLWAIILWGIYTLAMLLLGRLVLK